MTDRSQIVQTFRLQDIAKAKVERDQLIAEGKSAFLARHGNHYVNLCVNPPKEEPEEAHGLR